jgi:hypothetical protein
MTTSRPAPTHGAYGLALTGLRSDPLALGLVPIPDAVDVPLIRVRCVREDGPRPADHALDEQRATLLLIADEWATMDRAEGDVVFHVRQDVPEPDLVHPYLAAPIGLVAQWHGRLAFHAGGVVVNGRAWAVLGDKGAGKTTTLAHLAQRGMGVVADDLFVLAGDEVFAGPRCLDLRPASVPTLGSAVQGQIVREGERLRMPLDPLDWSLPFGGCVVLREGAEVAARSVGAAQRLGALTPQWMWGHHDGVALLDVLTHPMIELERPLRWDALPEALDMLTDVLHQPETAGSS